MILNIKHTKDIENFKYFDIILNNECIGEYIIEDYEPNGFLEHIKSDKIFRLVLKDFPEFLSFEFEYAKMDSETLCIDTTQKFQLSVKDGDLVYFFNFNDIENGLLECCKTEKHEISKTITYIDHRDRLRYFVK